VDSDVLYSVGINVADLAENPFTLKVVEDVKYFFQ
jgi:hypothetical protein